MREYFYLSHYDVLHLMTYPVNFHKISHLSMYAVTALLLFKSERGLHT